MADRAHFRAEAHSRRGRTGRIEGRVLSAAIVDSEIFVRKKVIEHPRIEKRIMTSTPDPVRKTTVAGRAQERTMPVRRTKASAVFAVRRASRNGMHVRLTTQLSTTEVLITKIFIGKTGTRGEAANSNPPQNAISTSILAPSKAMTSRTLMPRTIAPRNILAGSANPRSLAAKKGLPARKALATATPPDTATQAATSTAANIAASRSGLYRQRATMSVMSSACSDWLKRCTSAMIPSRISHAPLPCKACKLVISRSSPNSCASWPGAASEIPSV